MQANIGTNWAENFKYSAKNICFPADEDELHKLVLQIFEKRNVVESFRS